MDVTKPLFNLGLLLDLPQVPGVGVMPKARLLDVVRDRIRVKHYSYRTETSYLGWIRRFIRFHGGRHPREMGGPEVEQFLS